MDMQILRSLFQACIEASELLNLDADFRDELRSLLPRLAPLQVGKDGQLQEWLEDWDDPADHHRHLSHLWAFILVMKSPLSKRPSSLRPPLDPSNFRGAGMMGMVDGVEGCLWARLLEGERSYQQLHNLLSAVDEDRISYKDGGTISI